MNESIKIQLQNNLSKRNLEEEFLRDSYKNSYWSILFDVKYMRKDASHFDLAQLWVAISSYSNLESL